MLENVVLKHVLAHFEQHNILTSLQHGFRAAHSYVTQLVTTVQDLMSYRGRSIQLDVIVLDFSKAFDTVAHNCLLHKLHHYGIRGELNNWISLFLKTCYQQVLVDGAHSDWVHVDSGVPQGTVLGPLLFLAHINDLPTTIQSQCRLFAGDCLPYWPIHSLQDQLILQEDLQQLQHWADDWGMRFNASKCQLLRISYSQHPLEHFYTISDQILQQVPSAKYLGILLNDQLKWDTHIVSITARANSTIGFLHRNLSLCTRDLKELAYFSLARSILEYAWQVWDPHLKKDVTRPEQFQRCAARLTMRDCSTYSSVTKILDDLGWEPLSTRRRDHRLSLMFQITHGLVAIPTDDILILAKSHTRASLKHNYVYGQLPAKTELCRQSYFPRTVVEWNILDDNIVTSQQTIDCFRARLSASHRGR